MGIFQLLEGLASFFVSSFFMAVFLPFMWFSWVMEIFWGFDFTDWYDFVPLGCLLAGLLASGLSGLLLSRPASLWFKGTLSLLALWPLYPSVALTMLALQVVKVQGAWPQVMVDDPKHKMGLSPAYDFWFHATAYAEAIAGAALVSFIALMLTNKNRLPGQAMWNIVRICGAAMLITVIDPGHLSAWWMD